MFRSHSDHPQGARIILIKIIDFNKEYTNSLRMIRMRSNHVGAFLNV